MITFLRDDVGVLIGTCVVSSVTNLEFSEVRGAKQVREFINARKAMRLEDGLAIVTYRSNGCTVALNMNTEYSEMDIIGHMQSMEKREAAVNALNKRMIAPRPDKIPDDGLLDYREVTTLSDLADAGQHNTVFLFSKENVPMQILQMLFERPALFNFAPVVLRGVPTADYSASFDGAAWNAENVAYHAVVGDMIVESSAVEQAKVKPKVRGERAVKAPSASDANASFNNFDVAKIATERSAEETDIAD